MLTAMISIEEVLTGLWKVGVSPLLRMMRSWAASSPSSVVPLKSWWRSPHDGEWALESVQRSMGRCCWSAKWSVSSSSGGWAAVRSQYHKMRSIVVISGGALDGVQVAVTKSLLERCGSRRISWFLSNMIHARGDGEMYKVPKWLGIPMTSSLYIHGSCVIAIHERFILCVRYRVGSLACCMLS